MLCLAFQVHIISICVIDYNINNSDVKRDGLQFDITKLLSSDYFEMFNLDMDQIKSVQWNYAVGREVVGSLRKMVSE